MVDRPKGEFFLGVLGQYNVNFQMETNGQGTANSQLLELLGRYGVQAVTQLQPEQYGAFATELRALGAQI